MDRNVGMHILEGDSMQGTGIALVLYSYGSIRQEDSMRSTGDMFIY